MAETGNRKPTRISHSWSDITFILMVGMLAVALLGGAGYVLFLDLEGELKGIVAASALVCCAPLVAVIAYVLIRPLAEPDSAWR